MQLAQTLDEDESARLYRLIAETIPHIVWTARADGSLDFFNRRCYDYTGLDASALSGWAWKAVIHPEDCERTLSSWARALQSGERFEIEYRLRRADGLYRWHQGAAVPLRDAEGRVARWFGTCTDIELQIQGARILESMVEERSRALRENEQALAESESRAHALIGRLIAARESERRQLADELHDLIGQNLTALGIDLMALKPRLEAGGTARLEAMRSLVEGTINSIRGVMTGLRPPALEEFGLLPALRAYTADFAQRTQIKVALTVSGARARLPKELELALFRIVQESLTNAAKHSGAASARIEIETRPGRVRVSVADDGRGFADPPGARSARGGWGVPEMRERAEAHGGTLRIVSSSSGTRVTAEVPLIKVS